MKKKAIEAVPYLELPKLHRCNEVNYVARTAWKNIKGERHLFVEVYKNKEGHQEIPQIRYVATKNDFAIYFPNPGIWRGCSILYSEYHQKYSWIDKNDKSGGVYDEYKHSLMYSEEDLGKIKNFFKNLKMYSPRVDWWDYLARHENKVRAERDRREEERRRERLAERQKNTPELKEKEIVDFTESECFSNRHYLYYKKRGSYATVCCSNCGQVTEGRWKESDSYESLFTQYVNEPKEGHIGVCPSCNKAGMYKCQGKVRAEYTDKSVHVYYIDKYLDTGIVVRYLEVKKRYTLDELIDDKGIPLMMGASEEISAIEIARLYLKRGTNPQIDYHKQDPWLGRNFWDDRNLAGMGNIYVGSARVHPDSYINMQGTEFQYSGLKEYAAGSQSVNAFKYLDKYRTLPAIEMLAKMKLRNIIDSYIDSYNLFPFSNRYARNPAEFFGIYKERVGLLIKHDSMDTLRVLQAEKELDIKMNAEQIEKLLTLRASVKNIKTVLQLTSIDKYLNYIEKSANASFENARACQIDHLRSTANKYMDYLSMRLQLGYDMTRTTYLRPRDLNTAHDQMALEVNQKELDKRLAEVAKNYPEIAHNYRKLRNKFFYEDDNYIIRPARSAEEIVKEGRILHHCVGGNNYLQKHNEGKNFILMLRFKDSKESPYITVELMDGKINQWYGAHDKKPDEENMNKWLNAWLLRIKSHEVENKSQDIAV